MPRISVIVPVYKTEKHIEKCLESIRCQTFDDIEILCIDDCTPDDSMAVVERMAEQDTRIRIIRHERNLGLAGARNTGIKAAKSEYIAGVDSDDYIAPDMLEALWKGTNEGHYDVVVCGYEDVNEAGKTLARHQVKVKTLDPIPADASPFKISNPSFWNKLWRRSLFVDNDIFFPDHIYYQDSATTPRIYKKARNVNFIGGAYYKYLIRDDSVTNSTSDKHVIDKFRELSVVKDFLIREELYEKHLDDFNERVRNSYKYHANNVYHNNFNGDAATDEYLRFLLLMREAFLLFDDGIREMSLREKAQALMKGKRLFATALADSTESSVAPATVRPAAVPPRNLPETPRILVLTLYAGENEFDRCCASLAAQTYGNWDHKIFKNMGNVEGHHALYSAVMDNADKYDLFIKLDADMLLSGTHVLQDIVGMFKSTADLDHLIVACDDFMTGRPIIGVHTFSNRVRWNRRPDGIFLDPSPSRPGRRKIIEEPETSFFQHTPDPAPFQAFHFGAHRALKLTQRGRSAAEKRTEAMRTQWDTLYHAWEQFRILGDRRHALALVAADMVIAGEIGEGAHDYADLGLRRAFEATVTLSDAELKARLQPNWETAPAQREYFERAVGPEGMQKLAEERSASAQAKEPKAKASAAPRFRELYNEGRKLLKEGKYLEGLHMIEQALDRKPDSKLARIGRAEALLGLSRKEEATIVYAELGRLYPDDRKIADRHKVLVERKTLPKPRLPEPLVVR